MTSVGVSVGFGVVVCSNGEAVKVSVFDSHGLRFCNRFVACVLSETETFNWESFARIGVKERNDGSKPVLCKRSRKARSCQAHEPMWS